MGIFDTIWRRKGRPPQNQPEEEQDPVYHITMTDRDYSALLERGDVAIKFWLPELMGEVLDQDCIRLNGTSRSNLVRSILFTYLYGRHDWMGLYERNSGHYDLEHYSSPMFSKRAPEPGEEGKEPDIMYDLGKNIEDLKVWIPKKMKEDIQALADKASLTPSEMIREIIISNLFGHTYLTARNELMQIKIEVNDESCE